MQSMFALKDVTMKANISKLVKQLDKAIGSNSSQWNLKLFQIIEGFKPTYAIIVRKSLDL